jgi:hypothetical protein
MTNTNIQNTISKVSNNMSSLFSKEDVIKLLTDLDTEIRNENPKGRIDKDDLLTTFRQMLSEKDWDNVVDKDDVELSIGYNNQIEINLNNDDIKDGIKSEIDDHVNLDSDSIADEVGSIIGYLGIGW